MTTMQRTSAMNRATGSALAPVRPAIAARHCFKAVQPQQQASQRVVAAQAAMLDSEQLVTQGLNREEQQDLLKLPKGYHWYETMMILKPSLSDEDRDAELAKFEKFLNDQECLNVTALTRPVARLSYSMKTHAEGIYVLYTYSAKRQTARAVQKFLSTPSVGSEEVVLRHITFCKY